MIANAAVAIRTHRRAIAATTANSRLADQPADDAYRPGDVEVRKLGEQGRQALQEERDAESCGRAGDRRVDPPQAEGIADLAALGRGGE